MERVCGHGNTPAPCGGGWCLEPAGHTGPHTGQDERCTCRPRHSPNRDAAMALVAAGYDPHAVVLATCEHQRVVPVKSCVNGELLAHLCLDCDAQLLAAS